MHQSVRFAVLASALLAACGHGSDAQGGAGSSAPKTTPVASAAASSAGPGGTGAGSAGPAAGPGSAAAATGSAAPVEPAMPATAIPSVAQAGDAPPPGHDFTPAGKLLLTIGACGDGTAPPEYPEAMLKKHCQLVQQVQREYQDTWLKKARPWFAEKVPSSVPKKVVYPFAGGDLSTALTVYPDADELTTLSLEPAGDPRTLAALAEASGGKRGKPLLERALATIASELKFLYRVNFSNTANMQTAMGQGELPTQLVFGLSALKVHGYELVSVRYFTLEDTGAVHYLTDAEIAASPAPLEGRASKRNSVFSNVELRFKKPGGRVQFYRHIKWNLDNSHLKEDPRVLKHLESKGPIAAMTKAASYLLSWDTFSMMRDYLTRNVVWMVSDATGVAPKWGKPAGFEYETYGEFTRSHLQEGHGISPNWEKEWHAQNRRPLPFRFGYYDEAIKNHLVVMRKK